MMLRETCLPSTGLAIGRKRHAALARYCECGPSCPRSETSSGLLPAKTDLNECLGKCLLLGSRSVSVRDKALTLRLTATQKALWGNTDVMAFIAHNTAWSGVCTGEKACARLRASMPPPWADVPGGGATSARVGRYSAEVLALVASKSHGSLFVAPPATGVTAMDDNNATESLALATRREIKYVKAPPACRNAPRATAPSPRIRRTAPRPPALQDLTEKGGGAQFGNAFATARRGDASQGTTSAEANGGGLDVETTRSWAAACRGCAQGVWCVST